MGDAPRPPLNKMGEERCTVTQSLCGCDLKQGSLAIGIVYLILGIIGLIGGIDGSAKGAGMSLVQLIVQLLQCIICVLLILGCPGSSVCAGSSGCPGSSDCRGFTISLTLLVLKS